MKTKHLLLISFIFLIPGTGTLLAQQSEATSLTLNSVVIDPGHGGKDPGAMSQDRKTSEKDLTLKISKGLAAKIKEAYPSVEVLLTRESDKFVELDTRARIATEANANLFISLHINATTSRSIHGFSVYTLGQSSNKNKDTYAFNMEVLKRENSVIYLENDATKYQDYDNSPESQILLQLTSNAYREQSLLFAQLLSDNMIGPFKKNIGIYQGNFAVLRLASMPAVLIESGYISCDTDLSILRDEESINRIVDNLFAAFVKYKTVYDTSVSGSSPMPLIDITGLSEPQSSAPEQPSKNESESPDSSSDAPGNDTSPVQSPQDKVIFATQVLASSRKMSDADPYFKGQPIMAVKIGNMYKYLVGFSEDKEEAKKLYMDIKKVFKDSFFVKLENGVVTR